MEKIGIVRKSKRQQRIDAELGEIIAEMGQAMWSADKGYVAHYDGGYSITANMATALWRFYYFCRDNYGQKA